MRIALSLIFVVFLAMTPEPAAAGQMVVIEVSGVDLAPGQMIDGATRLELPAGAKVTLVSESGAVSVIEGPYSGAPGKAAAGDADSGLVASLAQLVGGKPAQSAALGVMRAAKSEPLPSAWVVDLRRSGSQCVKAGDKPVLWRSVNTKAATLSLRGLPKGGKAKVKFTAGTDRVDWPDAVAIKDGGQYLARLSGNATASKIVLRLIPADLPTDPHRAAWMADMGCTVQAKALLGGL